MVDFSSAYSGIGFKRLGPLGPLSELGLAHNTSILFFFLIIKLTDS